MRGLIAAAGVLVIPLALLLFAQWPLRDALQAYARQANDVAQIVFAVYAAVAISAASRAGAHLAIHLASAENPSDSAADIPPWRAWALLVCVAPWALFLLWTAVPQMLSSVLALESFSEGLTPGYFVLRIALVLLAWLVLAESISRVWIRRRPGAGHRQP